ncbi:MFS transporter [Teredinibacter purpureus]|uniref:MFS transporter n=1 Tax=Teredinibacter purpureus TaxID=2731756 RepID=UPI0005F79B5E|nr:MFS transporter [Teredinibacter purpureus]
MQSLPKQALPKQALWLALLINMISTGTLMMVMPMGPDFVIDLGMAPDHIGYLAGGATFGAALFGFLLAPSLDGFNKKWALIAFFSGKFSVLLACAWAASSEQLIMLYILSSCFGGPATGLLLASIIDITAPEQRGRAIAMVASGFSLAAIFSVPLGLLLSQWLSWRGSFICFASIGLVLMLAVAWGFPSLPRAPVRKAPWENMRHLMANIAVRWAMAFAFVQMFGHFFLIPHLSSYFQFNVGFARSEIPLLYFVGGLCSLGALHVAGRKVDKGEGMRLFGWTTGAVCVAAVLGFGVFSGVEVLSVSALYIGFALFMAASSARTNIASAMLSKIPSPQQRGAFSAIQGALGNSAAGIASMLSVVVLTENNAGQLSGFPVLLGVMCVCSMLLLYLLRQALRVRRDASPAQGHDILQTPIGSKIDKVAL